MPTYDVKFEYETSKSLVGVSQDVTVAPGVKPDGAILRVVTRLLTAAMKDAAHDETPGIRIHIKRS